MEVFTHLAQLVWTLPVPAQNPSNTAIGPTTTTAKAATTAAKPLKGRFVHLTDLHPDPFYHTGGAESKACHFKKKRKRHRAENGSVGEVVDDEDGDDDLEDQDDEDEDEGVPIARKGKGKGKRKKKKRRKARKAGYWGLPVRCASPLLQGTRARDPVPEALTLTTSRTRI